MQVKLLRAIQEKVVRPIGAQEEIHVDVRILSATNCDLSEQVNQGLFRQDLLYRINVIELKIPPLRSRVEDIPDLIEHILKKIVLDSGNKKLELSKEAGQLLESYNFPGNIRELENILERAATLCSDNLIDKADIQLTESPHTVDEKHTALDSMLGDIEKQKAWYQFSGIAISIREVRYGLSSAMIFSNCRITSHFDNKEWEFMSNSGS